MQKALANELVVFGKFRISGREIGLHRDLRFTLVNPEMTLNARIRLPAINVPLRHAEMGVSPTRK
jgi:hypothetical protein